MDDVCGRSKAACGGRLRGAVVVRDMNGPNVGGRGPVLREAEERRVDWMAVVSDPCYGAEAVSTCEVEL